MEKKRIELIERCYRLNRFRILNAPQDLVDKEMELINRSLKICGPEDISACMEYYEQYRRRVE